jgi:hypothetical protein
MAAADSTAPESRTVKVSTCNEWFLYGPSAGSVCLDPRPSKDFYTATEVNNLVAKLQAQIDALAARVKTLESGGE